MDNRRELLMFACQASLAIVGQAFWSLAPVLLPAAALNGTELGDTLLEHFPPSDHTPVEIVRNMTRAFRDRLARGPDNQAEAIQLDLYFKLAYLARHLFPPLDGMFAARIALKCLGLSTGQLLLYSAHEFYLNLMAGVIYGPGPGLVVCCVISGLSTVLSVAACRVLLSPLFRRVAGKLRLIIDDAHDAQQQQPMVNELVGDLVAESPGLVIVALALVRTFPFIPTWLLNISWASLDALPMYLILPGAILGYLPYAAYCVSPGVAGQLLLPPLTIDDDQPPSIHFWSSDPMAHFLMFITSLVHLLMNVDVGLRERNGAGLFALEEEDDEDEELMVNVENLEDEDWPMLIARRREMRHLWRDDHFD